jgi:hypothetical protein
VIAATRRMLNGGAITVDGNGNPDRLPHDYLLGLSGVGPYGVFPETAPSRAHTHLFWSPVYEPPRPMPLPAASPGSYRGLAGTLAEATVPVPSNRWLQSPFCSIDLALTVASHGWVWLAPWRWDQEAGRLARIERIGDRCGTVEVV